jgi:anti-sigma B factor antagonist
MSSDLRLEVSSGTPDQRSTTIRAVGDIDISSVAPLHAALELAAEPGSRVIVDLSGVEFIDSSGIAALVRAVESSREFGSEFRIDAVNPWIRKIFEIVGLTEHFGIPPEDGPPGTSPAE